MSGRGPNVCLNNLSFSSNMHVLLPINEAYENALAQLDGGLPDGLRSALEEPQAQTQRICLFVELRNSERLWLSKS